jgi:uncharacterized protein
LDPELLGRVSFEARVLPSEDPQKVASALSSLAGVGTEDLRIVEGKVRYESRDIKSLSRIRDQLRDRHVRSAARRLMLLRTKGNATSLMFNRQAAMTGLAVVCSTPEESPLGPIYLTIESKRLDVILDWLAAYEPG